MKTSKKGSVMPIVVIGLMMVSVIAFIFLSAVLYGNTAYQTSYDELDEKLILDEIGNKFLKSGREYADLLRNIQSIRARMSARCLTTIRITRRRTITSS